MLRAAFFRASFVLCFFFFFFFFGAVFSSGAPFCVLFHPFPLFAGCFLRGLLFSAVFLRSRSFPAIMRLPRTLNVQCGRKLSGLAKEDIMKETLKVFQGVECVQIAYEVIRVTFRTEDGFRAAKELTGVRLAGLWCPILGGGPPLTMVHVFDYPFEEPDGVVKDVLANYGDVKRVKKQAYVSCPDVYTGTRLVSLAIDSTPPRQATIGG